MSRKEVEDHISKESLPEQQRIRKLLEHSCSMYNYAGKHLPRPFEKEDLLEVISKRDTYVVDTNSFRKDECPKHLDKAFVMSPTLSRENSNTQDLILEAVRSKLGNLFSIGIDERMNCILVDRIDEPFRYEFDIQKLREHSRGKGEILAKQKKQNRKSVETNKQLIRGLIRLAFHFAGDANLASAFQRTGNAIDLPPPEKIPRVLSLLKNDITRRLPECKYNVESSMAAAQHCFATLLLEDTKKARIDFDRPNYANVFGDMNVLAFAIFLGSKILTNDNGLIQSASYASINGCNLATV